MNDSPLYALAGTPLDELKRQFKEKDLSDYQATVLFRGIHRYGLFQPEKIPELGHKTYSFLEQISPEKPLELRQKQEALDDTIKLSWQTPSGHLIESVLISNLEGRVTLCISSQAGCAVGCPFCFTGYMGLQKNLSASEIVLQYLQSRVFSKRPISNVVFMGMGEPLHNESAVLQACRVLVNNFGSGLGRRKVCVSTSGVAPKIKTFWESNLCTLAISLHATTDEVRDRVVPINRKWNLKTLQETFQSLQYRTHDKVMVEYVLMQEINDTPEDAERLIQWCQGFPCMVNVLYFNPFPNAPYRASEPDRVLRFQHILAQSKIFHSFRTPRGREVQAACGQLAPLG